MSYKEIVESLFYLSSQNKTNSFLESIANSIRLLMIEYLDLDLPVSLTTIYQSMYSLPINQFKDYLNDLVTQVQEKTLRELEKLFIEIIESPTQELFRSLKRRLDLLNLATSLSI